MGHIIQNKKFIIIPAVVWLCTLTIFTDLGYGSDRAKTSPQVLDLTSDYGGYRGNEIIEYNDNGLIGISPLAELSNAEDVHIEVDDYNSRTACISCHSENYFNNRHVNRLDIQCVTCHGIDPILAVDNPESFLHSTRRNAYLCSKCHDSPGIGFASYFIHEPFPFADETLESFPSLFWASWIFITIAFVTLVFFLPLVILLLAREFFTKHNMRSD